MQKYYSILFLLSLLTCQAFATEHPGVSDLLDKYQSTQDSMLSFMVKDVTETSWTDSIIPGQHMGHETSVFFFDGDRVDSRSNAWSNLMSKDEPTPGDKASRKSFMWDGQSYFQYKGNPTGNGRAFINNNNENKKAGQVAVAYRGAPLMGIFFGDDQRVDSILRQTDDISVQEKMDIVGDSECYVINAVTNHGRYTVWIDPKHDYNIAKAEVYKKSDSLAWNGKTLEGQAFPRNAKSKYNIPSTKTMVGLSFSLENVRFEKVDDVWRPMEGDYEFKKTYHDGRVVTVNKHHKRTSIDLHPDFDAERAFIPDIPDGTRVFLEGISYIQYTWLDGKLVSNIDEFAICELDKLAKKITEGKVSIKNSNEILIPDGNDMFIPKAEIALKEGKPFIFDLKSGKLFYAADGFDDDKAHKYLSLLGKGDIVWNGTLVTVREAELLEIKNHSLKSMSHEKGEWCNSYKLSEKVKMPYPFIIVRDGKNYIVQIKKIKKDGVEIAYAKIGKCYANKLTGQGPKCVDPNDTP